MNVDDDVDDENDGYTKIVILVKGVISCDVLPVVMFFNLPKIPTLIQFFLDATKCDYSWPG